MEGVVVMTNLVAAYTSAALAVIFPRVVEFAQKLDLPEKTCTPTEIRRVEIPDPNRAFGSLIFRSGNVYWFGDGYINGFQSPHSYYASQHPGDIPKFYGTLTITTNEAIELARGLIRRLATPRRVSTLIFRQM